MLGMKSPNYSPVGIRAMLRPRCTNSSCLRLVYDELRRVAKKNLIGQRSDHTLQATALVHEAYLRLVNRKSAYWQDRTHSFALAAQIQMGQNPD
jgi:hypothetical protein